MARVRMRHHISGGRQVDLENHSFTEWPEAGGILECGDSEAADLIRGGMADPVDNEVREAHQRVREAARELIAQDPTANVTIKRGVMTVTTGEPAVLPVPAATPAPPVRTEPAAGDDTPAAPRPVRKPSAPRPRAAS